MHLYCVWALAKILSAPDKWEAFEKLEKLDWGVDKCHSTLVALGRGCQTERLTVLLTKVVLGGVSLDRGWRIYDDYCLNWALLVSRLLIPSPSAPKFTFRSNPQERFGLTLYAKSEIRGAEREGTLIAMYSNVWNSYR